MLQLPSLRRDRAGTVVLKQSLKNLSRVRFGGNGFTRAVERDCGSSGFVTHASITGQNDRRDTGVLPLYHGHALGYQGHHSLSHGGGKEGGYERWARYDQFLARQHAWFLDRLRSTPEGDGSLLDNTVTIFGSATSTTPTRATTTPAPNSEKAAIW